MQDTQSRGTVYVCGKMRGIDLYNFPAFYKASAMLTMWGYNAINPASMDIKEDRASYNHNAGDVILDNSFTMERALKRDFKVILDDCDAIVVLDGWERSPGANKEVAFATSVGVPVFKYNEDKPLDIENDTPMVVSMIVQCSEAK